jgi:GntR family transcriptional repressor for pyruvate dehydrogenase complex
MKFKKIKRTTSSEVIVRQIQASIQKGELKPGEKLPSEREMSEMFGVCRASVREAARALTLMGYLDVYQGKGAYLKEQLPDGGDSAERLDRALAAGNSLDLIDMRNLLECKAVALAAGRARPEQLERIESAVLQMESSRRDRKAFYQADLTFHTSLAEASNNQILKEMMTLLGSRMLADRQDFLGAGEIRVEACLNSASQVYEALLKGRRQ